VSGSEAIVWRAKGQAERVLRLRPAFRRQILTLPEHCDADCAELIFGELVANVVRHARGEVEVRLELQGNRPVLVVRDHGPGLRGVPLAGGDRLAESGRGLAIVRYLSDELAVGRAPGGGTLVQAVLPGRNTLA
jgi:anti-sigma regulatory factor (Ser/Thr protein kinase)